MAKHFMWKNMGSKGKQYRFEQIKCANILRRTFDGVETEYRVKNLTYDGTPTSDAVLDIAIPKKKLAIRLNGGIHLGSQKQRNHDSFQREALEESGWRVIDFWEEKMPNLWSHKTDEETNKKAEEEVIQRLMYG